MTATMTMTVEDYLALDAGQHRHAELVNWMLIEANPPLGRHQLIAANLLVALRAVAPAGHSVLQEGGWVTRAAWTWCAWVREADITEPSSTTITSSGGLLHPGTDRAHGHRQSDRSGTDSPHSSSWCIG